MLLATSMKKLGKRTSKIENTHNYIAHNQYLLEDKIKMDVAANVTAN